MVAEHVDLIIPSTDYEVYYLSLNQKKLKGKVVASHINTAKIYLDKYVSFIFHKDNGLPFAESYLPKDYPPGKFKEIIVKPREGRGSRGININPVDLSVFDDSYMVQELIKGKEITTAFYVKKK